MGTVCEPICRPDPKVGYHHHRGPRNHHNPNNPAGHYQLVVNSSSDTTNIKPSAATISSIDLSIFKRHLPSTKLKCNDYKKCSSISRLLSSLNYFTSLNPKINVEYQSKFTEFMTDVYNKLILDDFHHLIHLHGHNIQEIVQYSLSINQYQYTQCDLDQCQFSNRHYRINDENEAELDMKFNFYVDVLDSLHFYSHHLYDTGFRTKYDNDPVDDNKENGKTKWDECLYDEEFAKRRKIIWSTNGKTARFNNISSNGGQKFTISKHIDQQENIKNEEIKSSDTYLDSTYEYLSAIGIKIEAINSLKQYVVSEEFDTESVGIDIEITNGNIAANVNDEQCINSIINKFRESRRMFLVFTYSSSLSPILEHFHLLNFCIYYLIHMCISE